ncbi:hypothetical protein HPB47_015496 [Ixodes persulcatus]|uniref:Uncharacterized protein n=1 Tax=Ixodes persulcatus TaxID=34615 RepID=A0AC60QU84_IXOPE|nr:hypothetical protein HPB47_015496 [Ixodes persulcatus]
MDDVDSISPPLRASRRRFSIEDDLLLLSAVQDINPFADWARWGAVTRKLNETAGNAFTVRAVRDRCDLLIAQFRRQDRTNLRKEFRHLPKVLPRQAATSPTGTTGTERTQAASPRLKTLPPLLHMKNIFQQQLADRQVDEDGAVKQARTLPALHVRRWIATSLRNLYRPYSAMTKAIHHKFCSSYFEELSKSKVKMCDDIDSYTLQRGADTTPGWGRAASHDACGHN